MVGSVDFIYVWTELLITKKFWAEELLIFYTANTTVEACAEWVPAVATSHAVVRSLQRKPTLTLTTTSGQRNRKSQPFPYTAKSKRARMTARAPISEVAGVTFSDSDSAPVPKFLNPAADIISNLRIRPLFRLRLQSLIHP